MSRVLNLGNFKNESKVLLSISAFCFSSSAALPVCVNPSILQFDPLRTSLITFIAVVLPVPGSPWIKIYLSFDFNVISIASA
jgi:hypothetical protein